MALGIAAFGVFGVKSAGGQCQYSVTVVTGDPCPPFSSRSVLFYGINDHGQACGEIAVCGGASGQGLPIVWTEELGIVTLHMPDGATRGEANDINNVLGSDGFGQVACTLGGLALGGDKPYLYDDGEWIPLGLLPGSNVGEAVAINDLSEVIGESANIQIGPTLAFIWRDGVMEGLALPQGPNHSARAISESSFVTGWMGDSFATVSHAYRWYPAEVVDLGTYPGGTTGDGHAVNTFGVVTGQGTVQFKRGGATVVRSFVANSQTIEDIGVLPGRTFTRALAMNDASQIIGYCHNQFSTGSQTFIWQDGLIIDVESLVDLPPDITGFSQLTAMNGVGQIAGYSGGTARGVILTPIGRTFGDVNIDCDVDADDLMLLLGSWGPCPSRSLCLSDFVTSTTFQPPPDGVVDAADLAVLLGSWTAQSSTQSGRN